MIQFFQAALVTLACTILVCSKASAGANEKTIRALIAQLSDDSFEKRESAQKKLAELGEATIRYLQEALRTSTDAEMRERAGRLLMAIEQRLFPELRSTRVAGIWGTRIALTPDGKRFVAVGYDTLNVGDFENGASAMASEPGNGRLYWCVAVSSNGKWAIAGGREKIARIFDLEAGKEVQTLVGHPGEIWGAALLPDGKHAVTGGKDKSIRLWDIAAGKELAAFAGVKEDVRCLALSPDGKTIAVGHCIEGAGATGTVRLWDVEKLQESRELKGHKLEVSGVAFAADGKRLVSCAFDRTIRIWDVATGKELKQLACGVRPECVIFVNDGRRVLCSGDRDDPILQLWDVERGERILRSPPVQGAMLGIASLPDGTGAVTSGRDGVIRLWRWKK